MSRRHHPLCCIVPPHLLRELAMTHEDPDVREAALRTAMAGAVIRGRRSVLGQFTLARQGGGKHRTIYKCNQTQNLPGTLVRDEGGNPAGEKAADQAYDGLGATYDLYHDVFDRDSIDDQGLRLVASVHYDRNFNNAFWDGQQMVFGDGDGKIFTGFTGALDVIGHELTHGVTQYTANLKYSKQPGALNESFSDVFGSLVKQYANKQSAKQADWLIGAGILGPALPGKALRSMADPGTANSQDDQVGHMDDYKDLPDDEFDDYGGVHTNSGIPNKAFYLVATQIGGNAWDDAGHIWYETLTHRLGPDSDFQHCADSTYQAAGELYGTNSSQQQAVKEAWGEVGIGVSAGATLAKKPRRQNRVDLDGNGVALKKQLDKVVQEMLKLSTILG